MAKWRKKPVVVEAEVYRVGLEDGFMHCGFSECISGVPSCDMGKCQHATPYINTLEGRHYISRGDYIITGVKGERYPCKPDIFLMTYERVGE